MEKELDHKTIVIDNGSRYTKAGFAGDDLPRSVFETVIGKPINPRIFIGSEKKEYYIGDEARSKMGILRLRYPIENGTVSNWDEMSKIWKFIFEEELRVESEEYSVLLSEKSFNPKSNREKAMEIMFEEFKVPGFCLVNSGVLSLYSTGRTTGVVVEIGDSVLQSIPIYEGFSLNHSINTIFLGGRDLNDYFIKILCERFSLITDGSYRDGYREIKEKVCYVALDFEKEMDVSNQPNVEKDYEFSQGEIVTFGNERFRCPEVLFQPSFLGMEQPGVHEMIYNSIIHSDLDNQSEFFRNIVLSGGSTLFPGIKERIQKDVSDLVPKNVEVKVIAPSEREYAVWIGGSILGSIFDFEKMKVSKNEYLEFGNKIIDRKCFF
ncbi:actin-7-related [Anaeramoeba ignava]|uniref:Actin-7-related n=1 Tax=Anaeramoeba ignava TaxID=1746090 RepID=A0A9Q0LR76_ANAIG|nr:actin-7-related [Anaeramoeba ignava]